MKELVSNKFDFFHGSEADQFNFYRIPKILFSDKRFSKVSVEAKLLYGLLLDRMSLSIRNGWIDDENRVFIYFRLEEAMEFLGIGKDKGVKLFAELDTDKGCGLIQRKRQGLGRPTIIYVMNFNSPAEDNDFDAEIADEDIDDLLTSEFPNAEGRDGIEILGSDKSNSRSRKNRSMKFVNSEANNTEFNNININNTEYINPIISNHRDICADELNKRNRYEQLILENIRYTDLTLHNFSPEQIDGLVNIIVDTVCNDKDYVIVNGNKLPHEAVKSRMLKLGYEHIEYVLDCLRRTTTKIRNIKSYIITALYNAPSTIEHYYTAEVNNALYGVCGGAVNV